MELKYITTTNDTPFIKTIAPVTPKLRIYERTFKKNRQVHIFQKFSFSRNKTKKIIQVNGTTRAVRY